MTSLMPRLLYLRCQGRQLDLSFLGNDEYRTDLRVFFNRGDHMSFSQTYHGVPNGTSYGESSGTGGHGMYNRLLGAPYVIG